jgi:hypothetical protein
VGYLSYRDRGSEGEEEDNFGGDFDVLNDDFDKQEKRQREEEDY